MSLKNQKSQETGLDGTIIRGGGDYPRPPGRPWPGDVITHRPIIQGGSHSVNNTPYHANNKQAPVVNKQSGAGNSKPKNNDYKS